jgi:crotonobetainyl-CoA:carnitine CoA-transferase CaiB-like acyl-CoA transferase
MNEHDNAAQTSLPLRGIRVIEFVHMVMGPTCGLVLADLGAEVIKVEPAPHGDNTRRLTGAGAGYWTTYNRNKKSLAIDLKSDDGREIVARLIRTADVLTENFRPDAMQKLGLGYAQVSEINPELVYCSMKGFLPGPYEHRTALDEVVQMMSGLAYMTGPEGRPLRAGASVNDIMGGMFGAIAIMAALRERDMTGRGQYVQSGLYENSVFLVAQHMMQYAVTGRPASPMPNRISAWAVYDVFMTRDGQQIFVGVVSDSQWKAFCRTFCFDDLGSDDGLEKNNQRVEARDRILPALRDRFRLMTADELIQLCEAAGLPYSPINKPQDLLADPHLRESGGLTSVTLADKRKVEVPRLPFTMDGRRFGARSDIPGVGQDSPSILIDLGYSEDEIGRLIVEGVIVGDTG